MTKCSHVEGSISHLFGDDVGDGVEFAALRGEAGEGVEIEPAGQGDAGDNCDAEERQTPRRDEPGPPPTASPMSGGRWPRCWPAEMMTGGRRQVVLTLLDR